MGSAVQDGKDALWNARGDQSSARVLAFADGLTQDYLIADVDVDCKYSQTIGGWMIPPEARDHVCLVVSASDIATPIWSMGVVRASADHLNLGANRDAKATLNGKGGTRLFDPAKRSASCERSFEA